MLELIEVHIRNNPLSAASVNYKFLKHSATWKLQRLLEHLTNPCTSDAHCSLQTHGAQLCPTNISRKFANQSQLLQ